MVQKSPASTIGVLAEALKQLFGVDLPIKVIGTRHGEKAFETLMTREEKVVSEDMGGFFRVPADNRDLNYEKYFSEGSQELTAQGEYNSNNTRQLGVEEVKELLLTLPYIQEELSHWTVPTSVKRIG